MLVTFWTERDFCIISDCRNSFKDKFKTYEQIQSSSEESLKEKCKAFIGMCSLFTWFNMQILNLCHK